MTPSRLRGSIAAAACALVSLSSASISQAATLAEWTLTGKQNGETTIAADSATLSAAVLSASLTRADGTVASGSSNVGFGAKYSTKVTEAHPYMVVSVTVASGYSLSPVLLTSHSWKSSSGPASVYWVATSGETTISGEPTNTSSTGATSPDEFSIDVSSFGPLSSGSIVTFIFYGASASAGGTLNLCSSLILTGTATETSGGGGDEPPVPVPLSVSVENFGTIYAGVQSDVPLTYVGDNAVLDISADTEIAGTTNYVNGVFSFTPDDADIGKTITFTATVSDSTGENPPESDTSTAIVVKRPFLEGFEACSTKTQYYTDPSVVIEGDVTSWRGTNFLVNGASSDRRHGEHAVRFRGGNSCHVEMAADKPGGAGEISFWHGKVLSETTKTVGTNDVFVSNNHGLTWAKINSEPIIVTNEFEKTTLTANVGGDIRVRIVYEGAKNATIDDILITDYDGQAIIEPAITEIADCECYADESVSFEVGFFGDDVAGTITNISATAGVASSEYSLIDGVFNFTPTASDLQINGGVIEFTITLSVPGHPDVEESFTVTVLPAPLRFLSLVPNAELKENFNLLGESTDAALPAPWKVGHSSTLYGTNSLAYDAAGTTVERKATNANGNISIISAGIYNFGTNLEDRAVGFLSSGGSSSQYRTCALMVPVKNAGNAALGHINVRYKVEKWRKGHGKILALYISTDGVSWTAAGDEWNTETSDDTKEENGQTKPDTAVLEMGTNPTLATINGNLTLPEPLAAGDIVYLGWFYMSNDNNCGSAQALAVDDVRISAGNPDTTVIMMK